VKTEPPVDDSLPSAAGVPARLKTLGIVATVWRGDARLNALPVAAKSFLWELHVLAVHLGTWPDVPFDEKALASMLGMNRRPVERLLKRLKAGGFIQDVPSDLKHRRLQPIDALVDWRPLSDLR